MGKITLMLVSLVHIFVFSLQYLVAYNLLFYFHSYVRDELISS